MVVLDAGRPSDEERRAVADFTNAGGRLVAGGPDATAWAGPLRGARVTWAPNGPTQAQAEVDGDTYRVHTDGHGRWRVAGGGVPPGGGLTVQQSTPGTVVLLADTSPLQNRRLDQADNAAFGVALAGADHRPVVFVEGPHGFGSESGLGAIPGRWKVALVGGALAALLTLIAASRRIGPAEETVRRLPPPRRAYVDAMGVTMARTRHPAEAVAPLQAAARAQVARRAGLPAGAPPEEIRAAAARLGWSAEEITALFRPASDTEGILAAGRRARPGRERSTVRELRDRVVAEVRKVVVGQDEVVDLVLAAVAVQGHVLLEGVPGVAKTLLANAVSRALGVSFRRVQFTPDMLPSDLTGTMTLRGGELAFSPGPVFTNVLLADEINRTPPKTQAALLEAMQEYQVTVDGTPHPLPDPFLVVATQNPIEYEGTYPLPEAQLDRFVLKVDVGYPDEEHELALLELAHRGVAPATLQDVTAVCGTSELLALRAEVDATAVADEIVAYVASLVRRTRELPSVSLGASPRAAVHLLAAAKASARLSGRAFVTPDDVAWMARPVLRHRLLLSPEAELERYRPDDAVQATLASVPVPR